MSETAEPATLTEHAAGILRADILAARRAMVLAALTGPTSPLVVDAR